MRIGSERKVTRAATGLLVGIISCGVAVSTSFSQDSWEKGPPALLHAALEGPPAATTRTQVAEEDPHEVVSGDSLKIDFFGRKDLSGIFRVRADGQISLPLIGTVYVLGKTLGQLEVELAATVRALTDDATYVTVETIERPPIYTVGYINKPNAYAYVEGMTVLHALALGGGLYRALGDAGLAAGDVESARRVRTTQADSR